MNDYTDEDVKKAAAFWKEFDDITKGQGAGLNTIQNKDWPGSFWREVALKVRGGTRLQQALAAWAASLLPGTDQALSQLFEFGEQKQIEIFSKHFGPFHNNEWAQSRAMSLSFMFFAKGIAKSTGLTKHTHKMDGDARKLYMVWICFAVLAYARAGPSNPTAWRQIVVYIAAAFQLSVDGQYGQVGGSNRGALVAAWEGLVGDWQVRMNASQLEIAVAYGWYDTDNGWPTP